ncbi:TPA: YSIRK-type signal peptide-containing protein, partial [Streptococcus suis]
MFFDNKQLENEALRSKQRFTIKKFKSGVASVLIGFLFMFSGGAVKAAAEELESGQLPQTTELVDKPLDSSAQANEVVSHSVQQEAGEVVQTVEPTSAVLATPPSSTQLVDEQPKETEETIATKSATVPSSAQEVAEPKSQEIVEEITPEPAGLSTSSTEAKTEQKQGVATQQATEESVTKLEPVSNNVQADASKENVANATRAAETQIDGQALPTRDLSRLDLANMSFADLEALGLSEEEKLTLFNQIVAQQTGTNSVQLTAEEIKSLAGFSEAEKKFYIQNKLGNTSLPKPLNLVVMSETLINPNNQNKYVVNGKGQTFSYGPANYTLTVTPNRSRNTMDFELNYKLDGINSRSGTHVGDFVVNLGAAYGTPTNASVRAGSNISSIALVNGGRRNTIAGYSPSAPIQYTNAQVMSGPLNIKFSVPVRNWNGDLSIDSHIGMFSLDNGANNTKDFFSSDNYFWNKSVVTIDPNPSRNEVTTELPPIAMPIPFQTEYRFVVMPDQAPGFTRQVEAGANGVMQIPVKRIAYIGANGTEESHRYEYGQATVHTPARNQIIEVNIKDGIEAPVAAPNIDVTTVRKQGSVDGGPLVNGTELTFRDGPNGRIIRQVFIPDGLQGERGQDGRNADITVEPARAADGTPGYNITVTGADGSRYTRFVRDGKDGRDGRNADISVTPAVATDGTKGHNVTVTRPNGSSFTTFIRDGKDGTNGRDGRDGIDGKTPSVDLQPYTGQDGRILGTTVIVKDGDGQIISRRNILNGSDGQDGKTPSIEQLPVMDGGRVIGTLIIVRDGDGREINRQTIYNGRDGAKGQDGTNGSSVVSELQPDGSVKVYNVSSTGQRTEVATIRNGVDGRDGAKGQDGTNGSSVVSELQPDGSVKVYNVSSTGQRTEIATIRNGVDGTNGRDGAKGQDGTNGSSVVSELQSDGSVKVYNVSSTGQRTEIATIRNGVNGRDGAKGQDGTNGSSVVSELQPDGSVKVYNVSSTGDRTEIATIRNGVDGRDGAKGQDGTNGRDGANGSSVVSERQKDGSVKVYNVSSTGDRTEIATIRNGVDGTNGRDGANGSSVVSELQPDGSVKVYNVSSTGQRTEIATIRNGVDGRDGAKGQDGTNGSSVVSELQPDGSVKVYNVSSTGDRTEIATIRNGVDGTNGRDGANGSSVVSELQPDGSVKVYNVSPTGQRTEITTIRSGKDGAKGQDGRDGVDGSSVTSERQPDGSVTVYNVSPTGERTEITTIRSGKDGAKGQDGTNGSSVVSELQNDG